MRYPRMSWVEFVDRWADCSKCVHVKYEDLRMRPVEELQRIVKQLSSQELVVSYVAKIVEKHSLERVSGRKVGEENTRSFMRKGIVGDWKNYFDQKARERFHYYAGDTLIKLGYESSTVWLSNNDEIKNGETQ